jgi:hypothetical protein
MWVTCGFQLMGFDYRSRGFSWRSLCHALLVLHWFGACCWEPVHHGIKWGWPSVFDPLFILMVVILFFYPWSINAATGLGASISLEAASIMVTSLGSAVILRWEILIDVLCQGSFFSVLLSWLLRCYFGTTLLITSISLCIWFTPVWYNRRWCTSVYASSPALKRKSLCWIPVFLNGIAWE